jgi:hypothetical protein
VTLNVLKNIAEYEAKDLFPELFFSDFGTFVGSIDK